MKYREYDFLKKIYKLAPEMNGDQKYKLHFIVDIERATKLSKNEVLALANHLANEEYVKIYRNDNNLEKRSGYIHCIAITCKGVSAVNNYTKDSTYSFLKNIIVPAIVSMIISLLVNVISGKI